MVKKQLYTLQMEESKDLRKHMDDFNRIILDMKNVDVRIDEDQGIILLSSLLITYEHIVDIICMGNKF
ncbi:Retrovirus-related Pol polyprotein from transposon TNT 1-94 [Dendrobium catenatum]|uniref:Retrovirus-related Pol polyprotein from transposon TNT 1-94 n=1 Tax=Dendrobium catenatum TaxID=906689 RepID=A0A2I0VD19_9ASPA|nr:Retrovirus-related Pol polyprotein from transposon TNT 1-94 [Dendrobium catenatum]